MEHQIKDELTTAMERLAETTSLLHLAVERLTERESTFALEAEATISRIVATVESRRETELEQKLAAAEAKIAQLSASAPATVTNSGRKTLPTAMVSLLAKQGVTVDSMEASSLDAALITLSLEQRIAVKAQLMRAGLLS